MWIKTQFLFLSEFHNLQNLSWGKCFVITFCYYIFFNTTLQYRPNALILKIFINKICDHKGRVFFCNEPHILIKDVGYCVKENIGYIKISSSKFYYFCFKSLHFRANRLSQILGELPFSDFTGFKVFGLGMVEISNFLMKKYKKVNLNNALTSVKFCLLESLFVILKLNFQLL